MYFTNDNKYYNRRQTTLPSFNNFIIIQTFDQRILFSVGLKTKFRKT